MKRRSDPSGNWDDLRARIIGLGERSIRKNYYPELEQRLGELERFRALLDQSNDLIFLVQTPSGRFADVNESACQQLGLSREAILSRAIGDFVPEPVSEAMTTIFADTHQRDLGGHTIVTTFRGDGREIPVEMSVRLDAFKDAVYAVIVARDITERKRAEEERQAHLWFFESMDRVNRAMQGTNDLEQAMKDVLDTLLAVFGCDRAWLVYPCDPEAATWQVPMERTTPEYPSVLPIGVELPLDPVGADVYRKLRNAEGPVKFGPDFEDQVPTVIAQAFHVQAFIAMAVYPKVGKPWSFGLHQCSHARAWTLEEERLFQEIGRRLSDTLTSLLTYRNLQESEGQIKQLIDASPVAMVVSSGTDEHVEWVNDKFIELFGYTAEDMPDVVHWWPLAYPDETYRADIKAQWEAKVEQAIRNKGQIEPMEAMVTCKDGSRRHIEFRFSSIGEKHLVTFVDLTERKWAEQALREREHHSQSLLRLSRKLEQAQTYTEVLNAAQEEVRDIIGYQNLWAYLFTPDKRQAKALFAKGPMSKRVMSEEGTGIITIQGDRMMEEFLETTEIMVVEDAQVDERTDKKIAAKMGNRTLVHVPILLFDQLLGSIGTGTFGDEGVRVPTVSERGYLIALASHMAVALDRIHLLEKRKQNEQLFRALVENSPDFVARYDREGRRIYVNPAIQKLFGTAPENMLGKTPADQSPVYTPQLFMDYLKQTIETGTESVAEMPFRTAQGEMHWSHMRFVPEFGPDGKVESVLHIGRDIHEIKENERRFRMLAENFPDLVMRFDSEGRYIYVNPAFEKAVGMPAESIIGKALQELPQRIKTEQNRARLVSIRRVLDEGIANESEVRWDTEKGERIFEDRYVPERDATGNVVTVLCIARDVTEQKRAEEELQKTNDLLHATIEAAPTAIIGLDLEGKVQHIWNPAAEKMLGWSAQEVMGEYLPTMSVDKEDEFKQFREWIRSGKTMDGVEVQRRTRDGSPIDYSIYASPLRDADGNITGNIAVLVDITERKQAEEALRESEERYRLIAENTADTIVVFDLNLRPTYISPSIIKLRGYSVQEALAQSLDQMLTPESLQQAQKVLADQMALEASGEANPSRASLLELEEYCKDGSVIWVELAASVLRDENSQPTGVLTVTRDITERKRAEDDLRASETRFRTLVDHAADAFFLYDEQGTILDVNRQACESLGYGRHELIGMTPYEIDSMLDHSFIGQMESRLDAGETVAFETRHRRKDGSVFPVEVRGRPFWHGERRFSVALARDITERKQAEEQRKDHVRFLESMDKVNRSMQSANDIEWVMNDVLDLVLSIFDCDRAYLGYPCDPETSSWSLRAERTRPEYPGLLALGIDEVPIDPEGTEIFRILLNTDGPVTFGPGNSHPLPATAVDRFGLKSFMSMAFYPKVEKPWQFGVHQCSYARVWTVEDKRLFHEIGRRLSDVLTVLLTYRHLQESEERYRQLVNLSPDGISIHSEGRVQFVNPAMVHMSGATSADQLIGKSVLGGIHPDFREVARNRMREMESSGQPLPFIEEKLLRLDGSSIDVELAAVPYNINNTRYIQIVARDITERKRAEEALRESEERLRQIASSLREVVWLRDVQTRQVLYVNPAFQELTGRTCESFYENRDIMIDAVHPDDKEWVIKALAQRFEGVPFDREHRIIHLDGSVRWVSSRIFPVRNEAGEVYRSASILEDITERKQHELEREAIITVSAALRKATTRAEILRVLLDQLVELFDADGSMIALPNPVDKGFIIERGRGMVGERFTGLIIPPGKGVTGWVIESKQPYLNNRADIDSPIYPLDLLGGSHCVASVPLIAREQSIGALWIVRHTNILERDLRLLSAVADIAANALHRVMLHEQTEQQLHHLIALHQIDLAISANFDLNVTLNVILRNVKDELEVDAASILLLNTVTHTLDYAAGMGFKGRRIEQSRVKLGHGCAGRAAQEYRTISYPNLNDAPGTFSRSSLLIDEQFLSHYATPLIVKGQVKGVLEIFHRQPFDSAPEWIDYFETLATQAAIAIESASLFENLQRSNMELMLAYDATIEGWSRALDLRDRETEGHTQRVTEMVLELAAKLGMSDVEKVDLRRGALLHDIGKMGVPDSILLKSGPLSDSEREIMQQHPSYALQMLSPIAYLKYALDIPYCHHEKWDGSGYPRGLIGEQIPLSARLFAVADVFDALTSDRPYRAAWTPEEVYRYIREQAGRHFDPNIVRIFLEGK